MGDSTPFLPDWVSAPGETIRDCMENRQISKDWMRAYLNVSLDDLERLLIGDLPLDDEMCYYLSRLFENSEQFWRSREAHYRADLERLGK